MATHSSILPWRIPWTEEPGGLQSLRSQRIRLSTDTHNRSHAHRFHIILSSSNPVRQVLYLSPVRKPRLRSYSVETTGQDPLPGRSAPCFQPQSGYRGAEPCALVAQGLQDSPQIFTSQHPSSAAPGRSSAIWSQFISFTLKTWPVSLSSRDPTRRDMTSRPGWPITTIIRNPSESCLSESWALSREMLGGWGKGRCWG